MSTIELVWKSALHRLQNSPYENPVVTKELRTRMRGARAYWTMLGYILLLSFVLLIVYMEQWARNMGTFNPQDWLTARVGYTLFQYLMGTQGLLIIFIAPSLSAGALTIEREQQTMEMLSLTTLSARTIIAGKAAAPMLFILMLLACSLPLAGMCLMFGSISPLEIIVSYLILASWAFLFISVGVAISTFSKKTSQASLTVFLTIAGYAILVTSGASASLAATHFGSRWQFVFSGLSGIFAPDFSVAMAQVFGVPIPVALVGIVFSTLAGLLLLTIATTKLPFHKESKPVLIRCLTLGLSLTGLFLLIGNLSSLSGHPGIASKYITTTAYIVLLSMVAPLIPAFTTGAIGQERFVTRSLFNKMPWRKIFENRPSGGLWFIALWWIAGCGVIIVSIILLNSLGTLSYSAFAWDKIFGTGIALFAMVIAFGCIGLMLSSIVNNRQNAIAGLILIAVIAFAVFPVMMWQYESSYNYDWGKASGPHWQLAYLWPWMPIIALEEAWAPGHDGPQLWLPLEITWFGSAVAWVLVAVGALAIADKLRNGKRGIKDE